MGRPSNTEERRQQIVDGLRSVMAERGYAGASISAIGKAAGLSPGLVHYHFGSKREILTELVAGMLASRDRRFALLAAGTTDPWQRLDAWIDAHLALGPGADTSAVACWVAVGVEAVASEEVGAAYAEAMAQSIEAVRGWLREGGLDEDAALDGARGLVAAMEGSFRLAAGAPDAVEPGFAARSVRALARGLRGSR